MKRECLNVHIHGADDVDDDDYDALTVWCYLGVFEAMKKHWNVWKVWEMVWEV